MSSYNVLITGIGAPGALGTLECLKDCKYIGKIIGVDTDENAVGKYFVDSFFTIPSPDKADFIEQLLKIVEREKVSVILPQVTKELSKLAQVKESFQEKGCAVLVNDFDSLEILNNKYLLLETMKKIGLQTPRYSLVVTKKELIACAEDFGYPENNIVVKLPVSNGMRGVRILTEKKSNYDLFMYHKPDAAYATLESFLHYFTDSNFPELLVMEYLPGEEYTVDCLADNGTPVIVVPRSRDKIRTGITFQGISQNDKEIIECVSSIISSMKLSHMIGFQFKRDEKGHFKMLECNPRIQGTMVFSHYCNANVIKGALDIALFKKTDYSQNSIRWGVRLTRYFGGIVDYEGKLVGRF